MMGMTWDELKRILSQYFIVEKGEKPPIFGFIPDLEVSETVVCIDKSNRGRVLSVSYIPSEETVFWSTSYWRTLRNFGAWYLPNITENDIKEVLESRELWNP